MPSKELDARHSPLCEKLIWDAALQSFSSALPDSPVLNVTLVCMALTVVTSPYPQ